MSLIVHRLEANCMSPVMDDHTRDIYHFGIIKFAEWLKDQGISQRKAVRADGATIIQSYCDYLVDRGYTPATIHTYLCPVCRGYQVPMENITKPPRIATETSKGRVAGKNIRGKKDLEKPQYQRIVAFAQATGLRRADYARITGKDIHYDANGEPTLITVKSKGGKITHQLILPENRAMVKKIAQGYGPDELLFSDKEMTLHSDLHQFRRDLSLKSYYWMTSLSPESRDILKSLLLDLYIKEKKGVTSYQIEKFKRQLEKPYYYLRGSNKKVAIAKGLPVRWDRLALIATNILILNHWRPEIGIASYLVN